MSKHKIKDGSSRAASISEVELKRTKLQRRAVPALMIPSADEDRLITAAALSDPDALPMTDAQLRELRPAQPLPR